MALHRLEEDLSTGAARHQMVYGVPNVHVHYSLSLFELIDHFDGS